MVDKEMFDVRMARHQRPRLEALRRAGAKIWLCDGKTGYGSLHMKALIVNRRVAFTGSSNFTNKSHENLELQMRMARPPAIQIYTISHGWKWQSKLLDANYYRDN